MAAPFAVMSLSPRTVRSSVGLVVLACCAGAAPAALAAPSPTLNTPATGSTTSDTTPAYSGTAGDAVEDSPTVTVRIYSGIGTGGEVIQELATSRSGTTWSVEGSPPLADGVYTAQADQSDLVGDVGHSDSAIFTVDTAAPDTAMVSGPTGPTNDPEPVFGFTSSGADHFVCRLYAAGHSADSDFAGCTSPRTTSPLEDGQYVFEAAAVDAAGNKDDSPASRTFVVDTVAPSTSLVAGPGDTPTQDATFVFSASEPATFECRLDQAAWDRCVSPQSYSDLALGPHRFEVRAADEAGNVEASPAARTWQVLKAGGTIPGVEQQAVALAGAIARMRRTLSHTSLRRLYRKRSVTLRGFRTLTAGELECRVTTRIRLRSGRYRRVALLRGRRSAPGAGDYSVAAELTKQGRRLVRRRRQLVVTLRLTFTDRAGRSLWAQMDATMTR